MTFSRPRRQVFVIIINFFFLKGENRKQVNITAMGNLVNFIRTVSSLLVKAIKKPQNAIMQVINTKMTTALIIVEKRRNNETTTY